MLVFEFKTYEKLSQFTAIDEAIRTAQFIRNRCLHYWMDNRKDCRSVEYKSTGWKLADDRKSIKFTDKKRIGKSKLKGTRDLHFYSFYKNSHLSVWL